MKRFVEVVGRPPLARWLLAGVAALLMVPWIVVPVSADGDFLGVLNATPPMSPPFINSPGYSNIRSGPVTVVFTTQVVNLTDNVVTILLDVKVNRVMTYYGRNVADGQPGQRGITFKTGDYLHTADVTYGTPFQMQITVQPKGAPPLAVSFTTVMKTCGYFQFDIGKHISSRTYDNMSTGFARVLGCKTAGGIGGVGGASASSPHGQVLADTGIPAAGGLLGALMVLIGVLGMRIRRH